MRSQHFAPLSPTWPPRPPFFPMIRFEPMRRVAIVSPIRTAVGKYLGALSDVPGAELAAVVLKALVQRSGVDPQRIDDVVLAQSYGSGEAPCIGRWAALAADLPIEVPGYQVDRRCGSGLQAVI